MVGCFLGGKDTHFGTTMYEAPAKCCILDRFGPALNMLSLLKPRRVYSDLAKITCNFQAEQVAQDISETNFWLPVY